jgi:hypothetical protein
VREIKENARIDIQNKITANRRISHTQDVHYDYEGGNKCNTLHHAPCDGHQLYALRLSNAMHDRMKNHDAYVNGGTK